MNQQLQINVLRRGTIVYYTINFNQHKMFYEFNQESVVDDFLNTVYERFESGAEYKIQGYVEFINYQQTEIQLDTLIPTLGVRQKKIFSKE